MIKRENLITAGLIAVILILVYLITTSRYEIPEAPRITEPGISDSWTTQTLATDAETVFVAAVDRFPAFGKTDLFSTIIPRPTPVPRATPKPKEPPALRVLIRYWVLLGSFGNEVIIQNRRTRKEFFMKLNETREETYQGKKFQIKLIKITGNDATFQFKDQTETLSVY